MRLFHYCCSHSYVGIRADGVLRPHRQIALADIELVWLTDLEDATREALGLSSDTLRCDRMEHRVEVDAEAVRRAVHWPQFARRLPLELRHRLEMVDGVLPMHWYVSTAPLLVAAALAPKP